MRSPLPDTSKWLPDTHQSGSLKNTFLRTCRGVESRIRAEAVREREFNIYNFDSGSGVEDIVRDQLSMLLPHRYEVIPGVIVDKQGWTCHECDVVVTNAIWFPLLKYGATPESRRVHIPVEAVYSVIEVKQALTEASLDQAMEKIVTYKRLARARTEYGHLVENHEILNFKRPDRGLNHRFDVILAVSCQPDEVDILTKRFFQINETLAPHERVNALTILGVGFACYRFRSNERYHDVLYPELVESPLIPSLWRTSSDSFYFMYMSLWTHLTLTVLEAKGLHDYGWHGAEHFCETIILE
jgi:hypothetical protein